MSTTPTLFLKLLGGFLPSSKTPAATALAASMANDLTDQPGLPERIFQIAELGLIRRAAELRRVAHLYASETADTLHRLRNPTLFKSVVRRLRAA
jgi:hypothetical protein